MEVLLQLKGCLFNTAGSRPFVKDLANETGARSRESMWFFLLRALSCRVGDKGGDEVSLSIYMHETVKKFKKKVVSL